MTACGDDSTVAPPRDTGRDVATDVRDAGPDAADALLDDGTGDAPDDAPDAGDASDAPGDTATDPGVLPTNPLADCDWNESAPLLLLESELASGVLSASSSSEGFILTAAARASAQEDIVAVRVPESGGSPVAEFVTEDTAVTRDPAIAAMGSDYLALFVDNSAVDFDIRGRSVGFASGALGAIEPYQSGLGRTDSPSFSSQHAPTSYFFIRDDGEGARTLFGQSVEGGTPTRVLPGESAIGRYQVLELSAGGYFLVASVGSGRVISAFLAASTFEVISETELASEGGAGSVAALEFGDSIIAAFDVLSSGASEVHVRTWESEVLSPIERVIPAPGSASASTSLMSGDRAFVGTLATDGLFLALLGSDGAFLAGQDGPALGSGASNLVSAASEDGETLFVAWREGSGDVFGMRYDCPEPEESQ